MLLSQRAVLQAGFTGLVYGSGFRIPRLQGRDILRGEIHGVYLGGGERAAHSLRFNFLNVFFFFSPVFGNSCERWGGRNPLWLLG